MQFRFVERDENDKLIVKAYCEVDDYDTMFKFLTFAMEHNCSCCIETNPKDIVDQDGDVYCVESISFVPRHFGNKVGEYFKVEIKEDNW